MRIDRKISESLIREALAAGRWPTHRILIFRWGLRFCARTAAFTGLQMWKTRLTLLTNCAERTAFFKAVSKDRENLRRSPLWEGRKGATVTVAGLLRTLRCMSAGDDGILQSGPVCGDPGQKPGGLPGSIFWRSCFPWGLGPGIWLRNRSADEDGKMKEFAMSCELGQKTCGGRVELHCHLDGSLPLETVRALTGGKEITLSDLQVEPDCRSLKEYLEKFDIPLSAMQTREGLYAAARDFYTFSGGGWRPLCGSAICAHAVGASRTVLRAGAGECAGRTFAGPPGDRIDSRVIVCAMRHHPQEKNLEMMRTARNYLGQGVCALDLAGDEAAYPLKEFRQLFAEAKKLEFPFTIHAGECQSLENVREAVELGAARIGHGIALSKDPELMKTWGGWVLVWNFVPPVISDPAASPETYPLRKFLQARLAVSINTDNRTVSGTTLSKELELAARLSGGLGDERLFTENAVRTAFLSGEEKEELLGKLEIS